MRATFITLAIDDGADPEVLETRVTHTRKSRSAFDGYNRGLQFDSGVADFSAIDGRHDLYLQKLLHDAVITVDESGAAAAAATGGLGTSSVPEPLKVDRPFVFLVYDHVTGSVRFLGRLADPTA